MKIAVISDTHSGSINDLNDTLVRTLSAVDLIIHAGDFTEKRLLDDLKKLAEVEAVCGNMDTGELRNLLPPKKVFEANGKSIGLTHGTGSRGGIEDRVWRMFDEPDIIVFGHSHRAENRLIQQCRMFNPGPARDSYGLLTIDDEIKAEIIRY